MVKRIVGWTGSEIDGERMGDIIRKYNSEKDSSILMNFDGANTNTSLFILEIDDEHDRVRVITVSKKGIEIIDHLPKIEPEGWLGMNSEH
jgi:hypothetical protein